MKWLLIGLVRGYQILVSPFLGQTCRYYPSCSAYALEALRVHGAIKGTWLAVRRLLRCHPWSPGGVDHVPPHRSQQSSQQPPEHSPEQPSQHSAEPPLERAERATDFRPATAGGHPPRQGA